MGGDGMQKMAGDAGDVGDTEDTEGAGDRIEPAVRQALQKQHSEVVLFLHLGKKKSPTESEYRLRRA
jgi:hypothetical protein